MAVDEKLRSEITYLGKLFAEAIREHAGEKAIELVEKVRGEARDFRDGDASMGDELAKLLRGLDAHELAIVIQAFSGFLELANLAEDRQRVRAIRQRERTLHPQPRRESAQAAIQSLAEQGFTAQQVGETLSKIDIELVFTAHPTEAKRKSLRAKLRNLRGFLDLHDDEDLLPREEKLNDLRIRSELGKMWQTDLVRPNRPTVMEEVERGLSFQEALWNTVPKVMEELRSALKTSYPENTPDTPRAIRFGSWMGGDRDGNPYVTPEFTEQTCLWLRQAALDDHLVTCKRLIESISISCGATPECAALRGAIQEAPRRLPWRRAADRRTGRRGIVPPLVADRLLAFGADPQDDPGRGGRRTAHIPRSANCSPTCTLCATHSWRRTTKPSSKRMSSPGSTKSTPSVSKQPGSTSANTQACTAG